MNFCSLTANLKNYFDFTKSFPNDYLLTPIIHFFKIYFYYLMRPFSDQRTSSRHPYDEQSTSRGRPQDQFTDHHLTISYVLRTSVCCLGTVFNNCHTSLTAFIFPKWHSHFLHSPHTTCMCIFHTSLATSHSVTLPSVTFSPPIPDCILTYLQLTKYILHDYHTSSMTFTSS